MNSVNQGNGKCNVDSLRDLGPVLQVQISKLADYLFEAAPSRQQLRLDRHLSRHLVSSRMQSGSFRETG